ncbi:MAG: hypothetical protein RLZZ136_675 [Pseudomonadota bacterium]
MPKRQADRLTIPLTRWADRQLRLLAKTTKSDEIAALQGATLLGERAASNRFFIPGLCSAGGKCQLFSSRNGWLALNLARDSDWDLLPALLETPLSAAPDIGEIAKLVLEGDAADLTARGRDMGMAIAHCHENTVTPPIQELCPTRPVTPPSWRPLAIDLSSLWAGPLASHLLQLAGAEVIKVETLSRPDGLRQGDPALFNLLHQNKANVAINLASANGRAALHTILSRADIVIEAARPRALEQLGLMAVDFITAKPGSVWISITGHGAYGQAANWIGFGDDCGVAGGLSSALFEATGAYGFVGDAIADPLTGIFAALAAWQAWSSGKGGRYGLAMSAIVKQALAEDRAADPALLQHELIAWAQSIGRPFPSTTQRIAAVNAQALGADNAHWLTC